MFRNITNYLVNREYINLDLSIIQSTDDDG